MVDIANGALWNSGLYRVVNTRRSRLPILFRVADIGAELLMSFSRNQIIGALLVLAVIWLVIVIRLIIAKA